MQRDGLLMRVPLVGGELTCTEAVAVAELARRFGNGVIELTNRGNLQMRGVQPNDCEAVIAALTGLGFGSVSARAVTISPFAGDAARALRAQVVVLLETLDFSRLSSKFVVHIDDDGGWTSARHCDAGIRIRSDGRCHVTLRRLGTVELPQATAPQVCDVIMRLCIEQGSQATLSDVVERGGGASVVAALEHALTTELRWVAPATSANRHERLGRIVMRRTDAAPFAVVAGVPLGRLDPSTLRLLGERCAANGLTSLHVTPSKAIAFLCGDAEQADMMVQEAARLGLAIDDDHPSRGIVACVGASGCWQTDLDTLGLAGRLIAERAADGTAPAGVVHVSGCDKGCAFPGIASVTFLGRNDGSGFDRINGPSA